MYFAWLGHYTGALVVPAFLGLFFWVIVLFHLDILRFMNTILKDKLFFQICLSNARDSWRDMAYVLFSVFNVLWACIYLQSWKRFIKLHLCCFIKRFILFSYKYFSRYSNELAYRWGTLDQRDDLLIEPRPLFQVYYYFIHFN